MSTPATIERYLDRHAIEIPEADSLPSPAGGLKLCVVIPCLAEREGIGGVIDSLVRGSSRLDEAEVIVVVNNPPGADPEVLADNLRTLDDLRGTGDIPVPVHALDRASSGKELPADRAGVGLARRTGMDLALRRLVSAGEVRRAAIACLDGDSPVSPGYADALLAVFDASDPPLGGVCTCAHPVPEDPGLAAAIVAYEIWMRYFELGLRLAGSPFSYPTIGSCLVASASGYALADGMPPRRAGEDFYFAQKLIKVSGGRSMERIRDAVVHPAARASSRVPFGTGRAVLRCLEDGLDCYRTVEPPDAFFDLRRWFAALEDGFARPDRLRRAAAPRLFDFLAGERAFEVIDSIRTNQPDAGHFALAVHHWFDGLRCVRYAHRCERELGRVWAFDAIVEVLAGLGIEVPRPPDPSLELAREWLQRLRELT